MKESHILAIVNGRDNMKDYIDVTPPHIEQHEHTNALTAVGLLMKGALVFTGFVVLVWALLVL